MLVPCTFIFFIVAVVELCNDIILHGRFLNITIAKWRNYLNRTDNIPCCYKNLLEPTWWWHAESALPVFLIAIAKPGRKVNSQQLHETCCCQAAVPCSAWLLSETSRFNKASICTPTNQQWSSLCWLNNLWNVHRWLILIRTLPRKICHSTSKTFSIFQTFHV